MSSKIKLTLNTLQSEPDATGTLNDYKDYTDPEYVGPGTWNVIHRRAFNARTLDQQKQFIELMKDICYNFPCSACKYHCTEYIKNQPMEDYIGVTISIDNRSIQLGMFIWAWKFHNAVNNRLRKPIMSWDTAYSLYSETDPLFCSKKCLAAQNPVPDGANKSHRK